MPRSPPSTPDAGRRARRLRSQADSLRKVRQQPSQQPRLAVPRRLGAAERCGPGLLRVENSQAAIAGRARRRNQRGEVNRMAAYRGDVSSWMLSTASELLIRHSVIAPVAHTSEPPSAQPRRAGHTCRPPKSDKFAWCFSADQAICRTTQRHRSGNDRKRHARIPAMQRIYVIRISAPQRLFDHLHCRRTGREDDR